jgi:copper chaperone CopZ
MKYTEYTITGMTCGSCVANVKKRLEAVAAVASAEVQLTHPQARVQLNTPLELAQLKQAVEAGGKYQLLPATASAEATLAPLPTIGKAKTVATPEDEAYAAPAHAAPAYAAPAHAATATEPALPEVKLTTYKPLLLIVGFIAGVTLLVQYPFADFSAMLWMRHFMAGFFIVFAFFKLLNLQGFATSYRMYDIVAAKWAGWGYIYPFVELALGVLYLLNIAPVFTNWATVVVLGVSSIGVIKSNLDKKQIKCACLGDVFNLPMSTVTIVEDLSMVAMAVAMLAVAA